MTGFRNFNVLLAVNSLREESISGIFNLKKYKRILFTIVIEKVGDSST